jgi:hypothetical protein
VNISERERTPVKAYQPVSHREKDRERKDLSRLDSIAERRQHAIDSPESSVGNASASRIHDTVGGP